MIETPRLVIRPWREGDRAPFAAMGADPAVMQHLGPLLDRTASDAAVDRQMALQAELGHCFWALERRDTGEFIGFCGLIPVRFACPVEGEIEIGWRLARSCWGQGLAREAAKACLDWGFAAGMARIASFTVPANVRSWGLMERLGLQRRADLDFEHPRIAADSPLRRHIVYMATA